MIKSETVYTNQDFTITKEGDSASTRTIRLQLQDNNALYFLSEECVDDFCTLLQKHKKEVFGVSKI